jgi:pimeloyl-ACP methyl ester carboxylesterase
MEKGRLQAVRNPMSGGSKVHIIYKFFVWALSFYFAYCFLLFLFQRQMLFPRDLIDVPTGVAKEISTLEPIWLDMSFGKVEAWFFPAERAHGAGPAPAVIFAHGNGELIDFWPHELKKFTHLGAGLMLVEYPGYGRSQGAPSQASIRETFITAYDRLVERDDVDPARIVLFGRSLGGGAVCLLAAERPSAGLILMSTFTSARSFATRYLAPEFLVRDPLDNLSVVRSYTGPVLVMHGTHDEVIPYSHGVSLYRAAKQGKMIAYNSGHNDCPPDWGIFWKDIEAYLVLIHE